MKTLTLKAPAKINLGLSILGKLPNDYHEVKTIYAQVSLFDDLKIKEIGEDKIEIDCSDMTVVPDKENSVYQAAYLIKRKTNIKKGINIFIKKNIPIGSGLGGGSSDAAVVLKGLNKLWQLNLSLDQLVQLAKNIGADVPYHLIGGVQLEVQGGEKAGRFTSQENLPPCLILVCFPDIEITSRQAYSEIEYDKIGKSDLSLLTKALKTKDLTVIAKNLVNDFETWTFNKYPVIKKIKDEMIKCGALGSLMSGKGSSVFGIFTDKKRAKLAKQLLGESFKEIFLVRPL